MHTTEAVTHYLCLDLLRADTSPVPVRAQLRWRIADPYVVRMTFETGNPNQPQVPWELSRELLAEGLIRPAGPGDVRITPEGQNPKTLLLQLRAPRGQVKFRVDAWELAEFLDATFDALPLGRELLWVPLDAEITALLDAAAN